MAAHAIDITTIREDQLEAAGQLVARAFQHYPLMTYTFPDPQERAQILPVYLTWNVRHGSLFGTTYGIGEPFAGVAILFPPGEDVWTEGRMRQSGFDQLGAVIGPHAATRMAAMQEHVLAYA